jgi:hypothetical protein
MFYEEKVINGVLCFRTTPTTPFVEFSKERLTARITELEQKLKLGSERAKINPDQTLYDEIAKGFKHNGSGKHR